MKRCLLIILLLVAGLSCAFAADYYIKNYDVKVTVGSNAVHHIEETIDVYFEGPHHGIVREIPLDYRDYNDKTYAKITHFKCDTEFETNVDSGYFVVKIGSADRVLQGDARFTISYDYDLGADFNEGYDLFYLNIIGTEWECPIRNVTFSISLPYVQGSFNGISEFFDYIYENTHFTSGSYGYGGGNVEATLSQADGSSLLIAGTVEDLDAYQGATIKIDLPDNWYQGAREPWNYTDQMAKVSPIICAVIVLFSLLVWFLNGRDAIPIIVAKFSAPQGFSPLMVGYVADNTVDDKDVVSMLFYWADEGLLSINEKKGGKYEFTKLKDISAYEVENKKIIPKFEKDLFNGFFKHCDVGDVITFKDLQKNNFFETIQKTKASTRTYFTKDRALQDPKSNGFAVLLTLLSLLTIVLGALRVGLYEGVEVFGVAFYGIIGFILFVMDFAFFATMFNKWYLRKTNLIVILISIIPTILAVLLLNMAEGFINGSSSMVQNLITALSCTVTSFLAVITTKRSEYGNKVLEDILGYREFIDKVEVDKLKMMIQQDPDLYYRVLSYAVVLGLEDKWARKFDGMIVNPPLWYTGYNTFDIYCMTRLATRMNRTLPMASVPKSTGSAGSRIGGASFGGGGFSGGGFGGGGGHAW